MSNEELTALKERLAALPPQEQLELARFLEAQAAGGRTPDRLSSDADREATTRKRAQHLAWLKAHREEYAGQYVALDGERLVGSGATLREAHEQARQQGVANPFLTHVSSVNDAPFGGW